MHKYQYQYTIFRITIEGYQTQSDLIIQEHCNMMSAFTLPASTGLIQRIHAHTGEYKDKIANQKEKRLACE